ILIVERIDVKKSKVVHGKCRVQLGSSANRAHPEWVDELKDQRRQGLGRSAIAVGKRNVPHEPAVIVDSRRVVRIVSDGRAVGRGRNPVSSDESSAAGLGLPRCAIGRNRGWRVADQPNDRLVLDGWPSEDLVLLDRRPKIRGPLWYRQWGIVKMQIV